MLTGLLGWAWLGMGLAEDLVIADFEGEDYGRWTVLGTAFGEGPARGTLANQMVVEGFRGRGLANSFFGGDEATGRLISPKFTVRRNYISFLVGGGAFDGKTCMNLMVEGRVVRTATGPNTQPGGSERLDPWTWDVSELRNERVWIEIVDEATGGWGHINVDHIVQTDKPEVMPMVSEKSMKMTQRYLHLPVRQDAANRKVSVLHVGGPVTEFDIKLAGSDPDYWVFLDLGHLTGDTVEVVTKGASVELVGQGDEVPGSDELYREELRPQVHFSSRRGWLNDPNGLVFYDGEYHLYYQHNPYGWEWGNMHWGHAVSSDLIHWKELPIALTPPSYGDMAFSGSAVVDHANTSGFQTWREKVIVAAYTSTGRGECIVYSNDRGRTFQEFEGNPVVEHRGRDPRLLWHEPTRQWVMLLYNEDEGQERGITFYTSPDLKEWTYRSRVDGFYECPDLFELPVDGDTQNTKWVLTAASSEYMIGEFDGEVFTPETPLLPGHRGEGYYAAQTFTDDPKGRVVQIGWRQVSTPGMAFNQSMSTPLVLSLKSTSEGVRLAWEPVEELGKLITITTGSYYIDLRPDRPYREELEGFANNLVFELRPNNAGRLTIEVFGVTMVYDCRAEELEVLGNRYSLPLVNDLLKIRMVTDRTTMELFANGGTLFVPLKVDLEAEPWFEVRTDNLSATGRVRISPLRSIWGRD